MDIGLLILRIAIGGIVAIHGAHKLLPARHGGVGIDGTTGLVDSLGFRPAKALAWLLALVELGAGLALAAGFCTPIAAALLIAVMAAAVFAFHRDKGFFASDGGYGFAFALALGALATAFARGGEWSLDRAFGWILAGDAWGITAAIGGIALGGLAVATRGLRLPRLNSRRTAQA